MPFRQIFLYLSRDLKLLRISLGRAAATADASIWQDFRDLNSWEDEETTFSVTNKSFHFLRKTFWKEFILSLEDKISNFCWHLYFRWRIRIEITVLLPFPLQLVLQWAQGSKRRLIKMRNWVDTWLYRRIRTLDASLSSYLPNVSKHLWQLWPADNRPR